MPEQASADAAKRIPYRLIHLRQKLGFKAKNEPRFRFYTLYGHVYDFDVLQTAWMAVRRNGGSPGIDGISFKAIDSQEGGVERLLAELQSELRERRYHPMPVKRVYIPKPDGKKRPLGIPTIRDRVVQMAFLLIIEPIFEVDFIDCSHGFRPGRSAHQAIEKIQQNLAEGRKEVYDADLKSYFDTIPHDKLMKCLEMRISDRMLLKVIREWLEAPIVEKIDKSDGGGIKVSKPVQGTPQGGVISPLLANLYLHWFDKKFHRLDGPRHTVNARLIRYADDFVIMAKEIGAHVKDFVSSTIEKWLGLSINQEKTKVIRVKEVGEAMDFLGYTFEVRASKFRSNQPYVHIQPKKKAIEKAFDRIRELTNKSRSHKPLVEVIGSINQFLRGWEAYFSKGYPYQVFAKIDWFVGSRLVGLLNKKSQRGFKLPQEMTYYAYFTKHGLRRIALGRNRKCKTLRA
jgi:RNA-directed DNA polymerase